MDEVDQIMDLSTYQGKRIFITGHTGFKGSWMCQVLVGLGGKVTGYALKPPTNPNLFTMLGLTKQINSVIGDIRDLEHLRQTMRRAKPEIVIHMAAQPLVRESYRDPVQTYATNVMGTVNLLEAVRSCPSVQSVINVTTDKVYLNEEWAWGYRETDRLNGYDPYSNSKSCSELVTSSYRHAFFADSKVAIATCRAGNVIGGGDFSSDRLIPDCVRAMERKKTIIVRNPNSTRPWQHVLEPICAYLLIASRQCGQPGVYEENYNIGPDDEDCISTKELVDLFCAHWGKPAKWKNISIKNAPHEANFLKLDCSRIKKVFNWHPLWHIDQAVDKTVEWSKALLNKYPSGEIIQLTNQQIEEYLK